MKHYTTKEDFLNLRPCPEGLRWALEQPSLEIAWNTCKRSDWMWWLARKLKLTNKDISVKYANICADHVKYFKSAAASVAAASVAADAATDAAAYYADAVDAAYAAAYAASAAADAAYAAAYAASAAYAADYAAAEYKYQADQIRLLILNPFTTT